MTAKTRAALKSVFEQGDIPQGTDYEDLIDSFLNLTDTTAQTITSDVVVPTLTATTEISAATVNASAVNTNIASAQSITTSALRVITHASIESAFVSAFSGVLVSAQRVRASAMETNTLHVGASANRGFGMVIQRATLAANTTAGAPAVINLPSGADIVDFRVNVEVPFATAAGATAAAVRASLAAVAAGTLFEMAVSASTTPYGLDRANTTSFTGSAYRNVTATIEAHVSIQGSPSAMTAGQAMLTVFYVVNP